MRNYLFAIMLLACGATPALAQGPDFYGPGYPNFYLGVGAGQATLKNDFYGFDQHDLGFSLTAGVRPISMLGAEISYVNLGDNRGDYGDCFNGCYGDNHVRSQGGAAFAVLYLPIPRTLAEVYGKAGVARLDTRESTGGGYYYPGYYNCGAPCQGQFYENDRTNTGFAWGGGVQLHWWNFAFRAEYEQFDNQLGRPSLLSAGAFWSF